MLNEALRLIRVFHDMSVTELAAALEVTPSYISMIESGKKEPNLDFIGNFAKIFGLKPSSILFFSENLKDKPSRDLKNRFKNGVLKLLKAIEDAK